MKLNWFKILFLTILVNFNILNSFAQKLELGAYLDTNIIEIGDQTYFNFQVKQPKNIYIQFPKITDNLIDGIEILSKTGIDTILADDNTLVLNQRFLITSFEDSIYTIPQFDFLIDTFAYKTDSLQIAVTLLDVDSTFFEQLDTSLTIPIFDIKVPLNTPWTFKEFWEYNKTWVMSLIALIILAIAVIYVIKRKKANKPIIKFEKPKEPAHIIAIRNLEALKEKKLWQQDRIKEYYTELTDILREYIEQRFNIQTFEKTSSEIINNIERAKIVEDELIYKLREILLLSDLVKFAKGRPLSGDNDTSLSYAFNFVEKTIPQIKNNIESNNIEDKNDINTIKNE